MSPEIDRLVRAIQFMAEVHGQQILEADDQDDLRARLDQVVADPTFHHENAIIIANAKNIPEFFTDGDQVARDPDESVFGAGQTALFRRGQGLAQSIAKALGPVLQHDELTDEAAVHVIDHNDPLSFIYGWGPPTPVARGLLDGLHATACTTAIARAEIVGRPLARWLARSLLTIWCDALYGYLRLLASLPDVEVPLKVVPASDRIDIHAEVERAQRLKAKMDAAANVARATGEPAFVFGPPVDDLWADD